MTDRGSSRSGALTFTRFAYPPNELGYCGPADHALLLEHVDRSVSDPDLHHHLKRFEGAWPYLELIAAAAMIDDPLDHRVVEAYWVGNPLLEGVPGGLLARELDDRFRRRVAGTTEGLIASVVAGAVPHHSLHVLAVYPWVGLLRSGVSAPSLEVMERCLIRWGEVVAVDASTARVRVVTLGWDGFQITVAAPREESFTWAADGRSLVTPRVGDQVAVHWGWVCDRLSPQRAANLRATTRRNVAAVNTSSRTASAAPIGCVRSA